MKPDIQTQIDYEELYNKNQLIDRLTKEFNTPGIIEMIDKAEIPLSFGINLLVQMVIHKRANISTLVGILYKHFVHKENTFQGCADAILVAVYADLVDWDPVGEMCVLKYDVSEDVYDDLARYQYPLPVLIEPAEVMTNKQNGYYTKQSSIMLKNSHHNDDVCLDHINKQNGIKFTLNMKTVDMINNSWSNLDKAKAGETKAEFQRRRKAFDTYCTYAHDIMNHLVIWGNEFYITNRYDKRGRCYTQGYHVNVQGNEWNKAALEFATKEITK